MTVEEFIEELQRQPNQRVPVVVTQRDHNGGRVLRPVDRVRFDGPRVIVEVE